MRRLAPILIALLLVVLAGCGGGDDPDPTPPPIPTSTASLAGSTATDGICQVTIPDDWVDDGTGRGQTSLGDRWTVFGGTIASDDAWVRAIELVKAQVGTDGATVDQTDTAITITQANGRGYVHRERFGSRYCEFSVKTTADRSAEVVTEWQQSAATLQPIQK